MYVELFWGRDVSWSGTSRSDCGDFLSPLPSEWRRPQSSGPWCRWGLLSVASSHRARKLLLVSSSQGTKLCPGGFPAPNLFMLVWTAAVCMRTGSVSETRPSWISRWITRCCLYVCVCVSCKNQPFFSHNAGCSFIQKAIRGVAGTPGEPLNLQKHRAGRRARQSTLAAFAHCARGRG